MSTATVDSNGTSYNLEASLEKSVELVKLYLSLPDSDLRAHLSAARMAISIREDELWPASPRPTTSLSATATIVPQK